MEKALLDTDIFSEVLKGKHAQVVARAQAYQAVHGVFTISVVTVMEIVRGFHRAGKVSQLEGFLELVPQVEVLLLDVSDAVLAGRIDADLLGRGQSIGRADPMIAAQAINRGLVLVSGNVGHY